MRGKVWQVAPWCLCAALFFCGADQGPKPIPEYMRLLLLEEQYQAACIRLSAEEAKRQAILANTANVAVRNDLLAVRDRALTKYSLAALEIEQAMEPLRMRYAGLDAMTVAESVSDRDGTRKLLLDMQSGE